MTVQVQGFQTPKNGSTALECQDAFAWDESKTIFAIADGVSDSAFQKLWADTLVNSFVMKARDRQNFTKDWLAAWLQAEQQEWHSRVNWDDIPWHGKLKVQQTGAQATFLGIRLLPEKHSWVGVAMGDCNLFRFGQDHAFKESIPNKRSADFSNDTQAFSSINQDLNEMLSQTKIIQGSFAPGDFLVLATDAMARWILERLEAQRDPLNEIPASDEPEAFQRWINTQRQNGRIKDDDTSLLVIQPEPVLVGVGGRQRAPEPGRVKPPLPVPQPVPNPLPPRGVSPVLTYVYLIVLLFCTIAGFWLGNAWQNLRTTNRLESEVQKPLMNLVTKLDSRVSAEEVRRVLLEIIVTAQPRTTTGQEAKGIFCQRFPTDPGCTPTPTPQPSKSGSP